MSADRFNLLRLVLVGKTGVGKSAAGNAILGKKHFTSEFKDSSVTKHCLKGEAEYSGRRITVVDTPGLFDTELSNNEVTKEIVKCIEMSVPGPHTFLLVIRLGRFTEEEKETVKIIQEVFGEKAREYMMVLFTHGDCLDENQTIEGFVNNAGKDLKQLVESCGNRYHVIRGKDLNNSDQIEQLLKIIDNMVMGCGGNFFSSELFEIMNKQIQEKVEKQNIYEKNEELQREMQKGKQKIIQDEKEIQQKYEENKKLKRELQKEIDKKVQDEKEMQKKFKENEELQRELQKVKEKKVQDEKEMQKKFKENEELQRELQKLKEKKVQDEKEMQKKDKENEELQRELQKVKEKKVQDEKEMQKKYKENEKLQKELQKEMDKNKKLMDELLKKAQEKFSCSIC